MQIKKENIITHVCFPRKDCKNYLGVHNFEDENKRKEPFRKICKWGTVVVGSNIKTFTTLKLSLQLKNLFENEKMKESFDY